MKTMKRTSFFTVSILLLVACAAWAGPFKPKDVSSDAQWAAHVDIQQLVVSQLGKFFLGVLEEEGELEKIEAFGTILEFNILEDLHSVTAYGIDYTREEGVAVFKGRFDAEKLEAVMKTEGKLKKSGYEGHDLLTWSDGNETFYSCFYSSGVAVMSNSLSLVQKALRVLDGDEDNMRDGGGLPSMTHIPDGAFLAASAVDFNDLIPDDEAHAELLKKAEKVVVLAGEIEGQNFVEATLEVSDKQTAKLIFDIAKGLKAVGSLIGAEEPELAELIEALNMSVKGKRISFRLAKSTREVARFLEEQMD